MKMLRSKFLRDSAKLVSSALLLGGLAVGCGSDASDPEALTLDELKAPGSLWIQDGGNGNATLYWTGSNNEDDFDGYNVYGMNKTKIDSTYTEGQAIELLDEAEEPIDAAEKYLSLFNYNPDKPFEEAAAAADGEEKFSALPVHQKNADGEGIFPTCGVDGGVCKNHSTDFARKTVGEIPERGVNGTISYPITGLKVGETYCFFVLSSMDEGQKVSMTSTNIACIQPRYKSNFSITIPSDEDGKKIIDFHSLLTACKAGTCATGNAASIVDAGDLDRDANAKDPGPLYLEHPFNGSIAAGKNVAIRDMGFYAQGFSDLKLPRTAPALKLGTDLGADEGPLMNTGGFTPAGRSRALRKNHVYVIAVPEKDATAPETFYYHWVWINGDVAANSSVPVEMRISHNIGIR